MEKSTNEKKGASEMQQTKGKLEDLAKPLIEYLKENYHPHTSIVITNEQVAVVETVLSIPEKCMG